MNAVNIIGRFTSEPEIKQTQTGLSVVSFTLAVDRRGKEKQTDFLDVTAWRQTAEFISKYFHKGDPIVVSGSLQTRNYEDKEGKKRKVTEIVADNVEFVPKSKTNAERADVITKDGETTIEEEDLPF